MKEKQKTRPCPSCGGVMRRGLRDEIITYGNASLKYQQPGWHCTSCDDGVLEGVDNEYHDAALHEVMARAKRSPISPLLIRAAREAVGVSQREAGRIFGGGPTAFYKYETAKSVPSKGMAKLLRIAIQEPELVRKRIADSELLPRAHSKDQRLQDIISRIFPGTRRNESRTSASRSRSAHRR